MHAVFVILLFSKISTVHVRRKIVIQEHISNKESRERRLHALHGIGNAVLLRLHSFRQAVSKNIQELLGVVNVNFEFLGTNRG